MVVLLAQVRALRSASQSGLCNNVMHYVMRLQPTDLAPGGRRVYGLAASTEPHDGQDASIY
jgi:hypothetical protein